MSAKLKPKRSPMIVYGKHVVMTLWHHPKRIETAWIQKGVTLPSDANPPFPVVWLDKTDMEAKFGPDTQGMAAQIHPLKRYTLDWLMQQDPTRIVVLDGIMDPHNLGAIIRSAKAFQADALVMRKKRTAPITPVVYKASAGLIEHLPIVEVANIHQTLLTLKKHNIWTYGLAGEAAQSIRDLAPDERLAWVLGSEGEGLSPLVKKTVDQLVKIPMHSDVESLNVSVAAAIALYHTS